MPVYLAVDDGNRNFVVGRVEQGGGGRNKVTCNLSDVACQESERRRISLAAEYQMRDRRGNLRLAFFFLFFLSLFSCVFLSSCFVLS